MKSLASLKQTILACPPCLCHGNDLIFDFANILGLRRGSGTQTLFDGVHFRFLSEPLDGEAALVCMALFPYSCKIRGPECLDAFRVFS